MNLTDFLRENKCPNDRAHGQVFTKRTRILAATFVVLFLNHAVRGPAAVVTVVNSGFEDITGASQFNEFTFGPLPGWDLYDPGGITSGGAGGTYYIGTLEPTPPTYFNAGTFQGSRVGIAFNFSGSGGQGEYGLIQTLGDTLQADTRYRLTVEVGNIASGTGVNGQFFNLNGFPGYRVDLLAGGQVLAQDNNSLSGSIAEGEFETSILTFETGSSHTQLGQALQIRLVNLNQVDASDPAAHLEVDFDSVQLTATSVPEPTSVFALTLVALVAGAVIRFRSKGRPIRSSIT